MESGEHKSKKFKYYFQVIIEDEEEDPFFMDSWIYLDQEEYKELLCAKDEDEADSDEDEADADEDIRITEKSENLTHAECNKMDIREPSMGVCPSEGEDNHGTIDNDIDELVNTVPNSFLLMDLDDTTDSNEANTHSSGVWSSQDITETPDYGVGKASETISDSLPSIGVDKTNTHKSDMYCSEVKNYVNTSKKFLREAVNPFTNSSETVKDSIHTCSVEEENTVETHTYVSKSSSNEADQFHKDPSKTESDSHSKMKAIPMLVIDDDPLIVIDDDPLIVIDDDPLIVIDDDETATNIKYGDESSPIIISDDEDTNINDKKCIGYPVLIESEKPPLKKKFKYNNEKRKSNHRAIATHYDHGSGWIDTKKTVPLLSNHT